MPRSTALVPFACLTACLSLFNSQASHAQSPSREQAVAAMHKAVTFFRENCSASGGYVYRVSGDLSKREGEEKVGQTTAWIQPPGTPAVGMAYLEAWKLTDDLLLRDAALETAEALVRGQLQSGGWDGFIEFDPQERRKYAYRVDGNMGDKLRNTTTFDDDKSQSCLRFLMQLDQALEFKNERVHEAALFALNGFVAAQYPNGAWPQRYSQAPDPAKHPVLTASFPETWSRAFPKENYAGFYTLNDNTISDLIETMLAAWDIYQDERFLNAAKKGGEFFILAQLPEPQPGWAQQYNTRMEPAWARKFEPPSINGSESQKVLRTLMLLYKRTADTKFLEPIPRALAYYKTLARTDGLLARFYEIGTNKPLYFTKQYELVYSDDDLPTHYGFIVTNNIEKISGEYEKLLKAAPDKLWKPPTVKPPVLSDELTREAVRAIQTLDTRGAWLENGSMRTHGDDDGTRQVIDSKTFIKNLDTLARYIAATGRKQ